MRDTTSDKTSQWNLDAEKNSSTVHRLVKNLVFTLESNGNETIMPVDDRNFKFEHSFLL